MRRFLIVPAVAIALLSALFAQRAAAAYLSDALRPRSAHRSERVAERVPVRGTGTGEVVGHALPGIEQLDRARGVARKPVGRGLGAAGRAVAGAGVDHVLVVVTLACHADGGAVADGAEGLSASLRATAVAPAGPLSSCGR